MIFAANIGNTRISIGIFKDDQLILTANMSSSRNHTTQQYAIEIIEILSLYNIGRNDFKGAVIGSVVPEMSNTVRDAIKLAINCDALMLGPGIKTGLNIRIDEPSQLGEDFVACAVAACKSTKQPCLIIDLETATKISVIDSENTFIGAIICPGAEISVKALSERTSQLPRISITAPQKVIGRNTIDCMASGIVYGTAAMIDGLCTRLESELEHDCNVIATGSFAERIIPHCKRQIEIRPNLIFEGLKIIYDKNK